MDFKLPRPQPGGRITPRIIIHGGAGNITKKTIPQELYNDYVSSLSRIISYSYSNFYDAGATALDVATHAVTLLENDPLYNSGHGAVFTRAGTNELECSIMISNGYRKRGVACSLLSHIKNPIKLAREILIRGETGDGGGAKDHCQYSGEYIESLAKDWGLEMVDPSYYWTKKRWDEHKRGLKEEDDKKEKGLRVDEIGDWERDNYIPLGTCGAVVLDSFGTICVATSTGGLTNKIPGRIGDTPSLGAGFWAEEWFEEIQKERDQMIYKSSVQSPLDQISRGNLRGLISDCIPTVSQVTLQTSNQSPSDSNVEREKSKIRHAIGVSSSGNGDSFIRLDASRTIAAKSRFTPTSLSTALSWMTGPGGELQKSAGDRWGKVHEGTGGVIGIELVGDESTVLCDYNCGGMFRAWTEEEGGQEVLIFRNEGWENGPEGFEV
ncbi:L-asparaginase precursor [Dendryphion nanum]|uniref:L-asparaginase n=1 Tax=Dendryphion nanum TaxID=256645 RepID=A0A9P9IHF7_9PLEO|nr:L-asparaginase precursor [Dendryphion nanum]